MFKLAKAEDKKKIAFLYLTRGPMPLEEIWRNFFTWRTDPSEYSIYVHPHEGFRYPPHSLYYKREVPHDEERVIWGGMSQVRAIKRLVKEALKDPMNERFTLMSESCIPLHPMPVFRRGLLSVNKSVVNACDFGEQMELNGRWNDSLSTVGFQKKNWRKSATWFALTRKHAEVFVNEIRMETAWDGVKCCDEHYLPSILSHYGYDSETTCSDGYVHALFLSNRDAHPKTYPPNDIKQHLFAFLNKPLGEVGFSKACSHIENICHFTARKFSVHSKLMLLKNMHLMLGEAVMIILAVAVSFICSA
jgi:hypothetical protein